MPITTDCPPFDLLVTVLETNGYQVDIKFVGNLYMEKLYRFAVVNGNGIKAGFCTPADGKCYRYIDGRIAADNADCFNKWSQCPLVMGLPTSENEAEEIIKHLAWLSTQEGHDWSNNFGYLDEAKVPRMIEG